LERVDKPVKKDVDLSENERGGKREAPGRIADVWGREKEKEGKKESRAIRPEDEEGSLKRQGRGKAKCPRCSRLWVGVGQEEGGKGWQLREGGLEYS